MRNSDRAALAVAVVVDSLTQPSPFSFPGSPVAGYSEGMRGVKTGSPQSKVGCCSKSSACWGRARRVFICSPLGPTPQRQLEGKRHHNGRMGLGHQPGPGAASLPLGHCLASFKLDIPVCLGSMEYRFWVPLVSESTTARKEA